MYSQLSSSCTSCASRGRECGESHKVFGSKRCQQLSAHTVAGEPFQSILEEPAEQFAGNFIVTPANPAHALSEGALIPHCDSSTSVREVQLAEHELTIPQTPTLFPDEITTPQDWKYLQKLLQADLSDHLRDGSTSVIVTRNVSWNSNETPHPAMTAFLWPNFPLSSITFRYASLTFASYSEARDRTHTLKYLGKFYKYAQEAISSSSLIELVTASYPILLYAYMSRSPFRQVFVHFRGICAALTSREFEALSKNDQEQLQRIWQVSLPALRRAFWTSQTATTHASEEDLNLLKEICCVLQETSFLLYGDSTYRSDMGQELNLKLETLESYLAFYWEYYLAIRSGSNEGDSSSSHHISSISRLESSIRDIQQLIHALSLQQPLSAMLITQASRSVSPERNFGHYPEISIPPDVMYEHIKAASLYFWAKIIENFLDSSMSSSLSVHTSLALLRLAICVAKTRDWPWTRPHPLFWVGLSLTNSKCPSGEATLNVSLLSSARNFVMSELQNLLRSVISSHPSRAPYYQKKFETLFKFLEIVDISPPCQDLCSLNNGGSTLFKCNRMTGRLYESMEG